MRRVLLPVAALLAALALSPTAHAACPTQATPQFNTGGSVFGRIASQWNAYFGAKVDLTGGCSDNQTLNNPLIVGGAFSGPTTFKSLRINSNLANLPAALTGTLLQVGNLDGTPTRTELDAFGAATYFIGRRSDGTASSPTALLSGDEIVSLGAWGYDGTAWGGPAAQVRLFAAGNWSASSHPTEVRFSTTASGSTTLADRFHVGPAGGLYSDGVTGTDEGSGSVNVASLYIGGTQIGVAANPTATAGPTAVNGTALTYMRSDGAPAIQKASNAQFGISECDNTSITCLGGVFSGVFANPTATAGPAAVNGTAVTAMRSDASPAVQKGSSSQFGITECDNSTITCPGGVNTAANTTVNGTTCTPGSSCTITTLSNTVPPQGRLSLATATPVMTTTVSAATTIYYTPYVGSLVPTWDGTNWTLRSCAEITNITSNSSTGNAGPAAVTASSVYDLFVWSNSGTCTLTRGPAWTNDTTRSAGTALVRQNGILLNNASITNGPAASRGTYVGSVRSNGSSQIDYIFGTNVTAGFAGVWNMYNRVQTSMTVTDSEAGYLYSSATIRQAGGQTYNQVSVLNGQPEDSVALSSSNFLNTAIAAGAFGRWGIGVNSTSSYNAFQPVDCRDTASTVLAQCSLVSTGTYQPVLGFNVFSFNESSDGTNNNNFNVLSTNYLSVQFRN